MKTKSTRRNKLKTKGMNINKMTKRRLINQKGGLLTTSFGWKGINIFGSTYGKKYYDTSQTPPRWRNQTCRKIFGFEYCTLDKDPQEEEQSKSWFSSWFS
jgi:hypothetical protein